VAILNPSSLISLDIMSSGLVFLDVHRPKPSGWAGLRRCAHGSKRWPDLPTAPEN
jgi:hypothetical protein